MIKVKFHNRSAPYSLEEQVIPITRCPINDMVGWPVKLNCYSRVPQSTTNKVQSIG